MSAIGQFCPGEEELIADNAKTAPQAYLLLILLVFILFLIFRVRAIRSGVLLFNDLATTPPNDDCLVAILVSTLENCRASTSWTYLSQILEAHARPHCAHARLAHLAIIDLLFFLFGSLLLKLSPFFGSSFFQHANAILRRALPCRLQPFSEHYQ